MRLSDHLDELVHEFSKLPGIGRKTAQRLAYFILKQPEASVTQLAESLINVKNKVHQCTVCGNITDDEICRICVSEKRNKLLICVVEEPTDVLAIEKTNDFSGVYHVLGGAISPLDGVTPEQLNILSLLDRIGALDSVEVILAMNPDVEGEATTLYLTRLLKSFPHVSISRIARGIPIGGDLEYSDEATLSRAMEGRVRI
ncbi:MAG: recombination mediator RecR [Bacteroidetes bacterium]|nr:recombination protein RecR [Bacteroidota bacterium]MCA0445081.1 recombination mediator RecR [Bacteroidota bacterium]